MRLIEGTTEASVDEVADGIFRINTPVSPAKVPGGFSFNQYLIRDEAPLLYHTGLKQIAGIVRAAVSRVMPFEEVRFIAFSHFEADECGALNEHLAAAPGAEPVCGGVAAMVSVEDYAVRPPRALKDGESLTLGRRSVTWFDTPHLPHAWECGTMFETTTATLLCGDLFTQPGSETRALTEGDILGPSEVMRARLDYFAHGPRDRAQLARLAALKPRTLACMHGSAWRGDGAQLLMALADRLD